MRDVQINPSVLYDMLQTASHSTSFILTPFYVRLLPCGLVFKYSKRSSNMVLPITVENNCIYGGKKFGQW